MKYALVNITEEKVISNHDAKADANSALKVCKTGNPGHKFAIVPFGESVTVEQG